MKHAKTCLGRKICVIISKEGIKVYGNRQAFKYLASWLNQLAKSPKNAYHECHATLDLQTSSSLFGDGPKNIWFLFDATTFPLFKKKIRNKDFEFTFMVVEEKDLETMKRYQNSGKLPTKIGNLNNLKRPVQKIYKKSRRCYKIQDAVANPLSPVTRE